MSFEDTIVVARESVGLEQRASGIAATAQTFYIRSPSGPLPKTQLLLCAVLLLGRDDRSWMR